MTSRWVILGLFLAALAIAGGLYWNAHKPVEVSKSAEPGPASPPPAGNLGTPYLIDYG